jgi:hypothetical protein
MSLTAAAVDPLTEPIPAGWDEFVTGQRPPPVWDSRLLRIAAWCDRVPATAVLVSEAASARPVAAFYVRHLGPVSPGRFVRPGRMPVVTLSECRAVPWTGAGMVFAADTDQRDRREAVRVFERALGRRVGAGGRLIAYRSLPAEHLAVVPTARRLRLPQSPHMVLYNRWPDLPSYLATLDRAWRKRLRQIRRAVDADPTVRFEVTGTIDTADACWLAEVVRRRYLPRWFTPPPPRPASYFERFSQLPGTWFFAYRDPQARLLAFQAGYDNGEELYARTWGARTLADSGRRNLYFDDYLRQVELMIRTGRRRLDLGAGMPEIKARYGARAEPQWVVMGAL